MRMVAIAILTSLLLLYFPSSGTCLEILTPPDRISTNSDRLYLVGTTDAHLVEIRLNNLIIKEVLVKDSIFHVFLKFGYGINEITIMPVYSEESENKRPIKTIEILSGPSIPKKYEMLFGRYQFHSTEENPACSRCHTYEGDKADKIELDEPCFDCHRNLKSNFKTHIPESNRTCIICHKLNYDLTVPATGTYSDRNLCYQCHKDKIGEFQKDYIHGPVAGGSCTICHDPHGSNYEKNLIYPEEILCASCHTIVEDTKILRIQHKPFQFGRCVECHDPHSTNHKWVLVKNSQELCMNCHTKDGILQFHNHPYNVEPKKRLVNPLKLTPSGQLECLSCHNPHASNAEHLLRITEGHICTGCHWDKAE
ncbi:MAG: cytochrome c3 family protein [candidate division Zixibacteria bacterium]